MLNDPNSDLQITPVGGQAASDGSTQAAAQATTQQSTSTQTSPAPAQPTANQPISLAPTAQEPTNKRAFNLDADVEQAQTGPAKPEKYAIPKFVSDKYPDLVELIKTTESMDDQEREYWFQILPIMTPEQIEKFRGILVTEKQQLAELDKEYEDELNRLNEKHLLEWKEFESKEKSRAIKEAESKSQAEEKAEEEALLAKLSDV